MKDNALPYHPQQDHSKGTPFLGRLWLILLLLAPMALWAQPDELEPDQEVDPDIQLLIETLVEESDSEFDFNTFLELLNQYKKRPLNLNRATYEDLVDFPLINEQQIAALLEHRARYGRFITIYELQAVSLFDLPTIRKLLPYVTVSGEIDDINIPFKDLLTEGDHQLFLRYQRVLEDQAGYAPNDTAFVIDPLTNETLMLIDSNRYVGSPDKLYARYRYNYGNWISYGFTAEKDAGEEFFQGTQKRGFDYYSAHLFLQDRKWLKALAIGDYQVQLGQGLVMWSGFAFRKGPFVLNIKKGARPLKPYTSVNENLFMRGAAATVGKGAWSLTAFGSHKSIDANITQVDTASEDVVTFSSFQISGYHRTWNEIQDRNAIKETVGGLYAAYQKNRLKIGVSGLYNKLNASIEKRIQPYNQFDFNQDQLVNAGVDYSYIYQNMQLFGETAYSSNGGFAMLNGVLMSLDPRVQLAVLHRHFEKDYQSLNANAFAEGTRPANERGVYTGVSIKPVRNWSVDAFFDVYKHPWLRFDIDAPSNGREHFLQLTYRPSRSLEMYGRWKHEVKGQNAPGNDTPLDYLVNTDKSSWRYHIAYKVTKSVTLKSRIEMSRYSDGVNEPSNGYLVYQDLNFKALSFPLSFSTRFALFETQSYDARIYAYENDLLYVFSVPAYAGKGSRFYVMMRYKIKRGIDFWIRYSQTYLVNDNTQGSGLELIEGPSKSELKAQLRFKF